MGARESSSKADAATGASPAAGHTPGPWVVMRFKPYEWSSETIFIRAPNAMVKNDRGPDYAQEIMSDEDYPTKEADSRLIAAAPELLEALAELLDGMRASRDDIGVDDWIEIAETAIAKALATNGATKRQDETADDASGMNPNAV